MHGLAFALPSGGHDSDNERRQFLKEGAVSDGMMMRSMGAGLRLQLTDRTHRPLRGAAAALADAFAVTSDDLDVSSQGNRGATHRNPTDYNGASGGGKKEQDHTGKRGMSFHLGIQS